MTSFRIFEIILYSCLNLLPYLGLALYPFADKLSFSKVKVGLFIFLLLYMQQPVHRDKRECCPLLVPFVMAYFIFSL